MSAKILAGKEFADNIKEEAKKKADAIQKKYGISPGLAVIIVGIDPASKVYVRNKHKACEASNIYSLVIEMPEDTTKEALLGEIAKLNAAPKIHGILVQLPLPKQLTRHEAEILAAISPLKDVDGFHPYNAGLLEKGTPFLLPCTPAGIIELLKRADVAIDSKHAVIVGRSNIVGKPMAQLLLGENATVTICHSHTKNLASITCQADILVVAIGKPAFITADMVKQGAVVIDVGINRLPPKSEGERSRLVGDVDYDAVSKVASAITPVPGGIGLLTVAMLMKNVTIAANKQLENKFC